MYPKDRLPRSAKTPIPPNLGALLFHVMGKACEENCGGLDRHSWEEVLQPRAGSDSAAFPMSAQDWRKAEMFSHLLQQLLVAHHLRSSSSRDCDDDHHPVTPGSNHDSIGSGTAIIYPASSRTCPSSTPKILQSNGKVKGKGKISLQSNMNGEQSAGTATPAANSAWPRQYVPRVTPKELSRVDEPSAPMKSVGRVAASRRVNGGTDGAVASLAASKTGPGAFETPRHAHYVSSPASSVGHDGRTRDHSPSRYPARLRSRRFPQLGAAGDSPEPPMPSGLRQSAGMEDGSDASAMSSPRAVLNNFIPYLPGAVEAGTDENLRHSNAKQDDGLHRGMRTRTAPQSPRGSEQVFSSCLGTSTPETGSSRSMSGSNGSANTVPAGSDARKPSPKEGIPRQRAGTSGGRSGSRAPVPRSSVGGRNYTDNHVKQLVLIEAAVVASATPEDQATYNLPRQGRTLTLTNVFKFVALRGANAMYALAMRKQVENQTGRHSNFFDGKIDARIVSVIKKDIGDEAITKSRKFSKILLSLVAEGCTSPDCDWDYNSFTSESIAKLQATYEAQNGSSALSHLGDSLPSSSASNNAPPAAITSSPWTGGFSNGVVNGGHGKRRLDLGRDESQTPSPRLKKLKRAARARQIGGESTPTAGVIANARSPPKEEDDMRAAEVLQGLKDLGGGGN